MRGQCVYCCCFGPRGWQQQQPLVNTSAKKAVALTKAVMKNAQQPTTLDVGPWHCLITRYRYIQNAGCNMCLARVVMLITNCIQHFFYA